MRRIQGKKHKMGTYEINKISLSVFDDKRFVLNNGIHTLAYFHKDLRKQIHADDYKQEEIQKDSNKWLQIKTNACKQGLDRWVHRGTRQQYNKEVFKTISSLFIFLRKDFVRTKSNKTQNKRLSPSQKLP